jgi:hypothetical protein
LGGVLNSWVTGFVVSKGNFVTSVVGAGVEVGLGLGVGVALADVNLVLDLVLVLHLGVGLGVEYLLTSLVKDAFLVCFFRVFLKSIFGFAKTVASLSVIAKEGKVKALKKNINAYNKEIFFIRNTSCGIIMIFI